MRPAARRVLVFWLVAAAIAALAGAWFHGLLSGPSPAQREREETQRIQERVRELTH
jgi:hypothetical protein